MKRTASREARKGRQNDPPAAPSAAHMERVRAPAWLAAHGYRAKKLEINQWLPAIGFRHCDGSSRGPLQHAMN